MTSSILITNKLGKINFEDNEELLNILKVHALYHIRRVGKYLQQGEESFEDKWNKIYLADIVNIAHAHAILITASSFVEGIKNVKISQNLLMHLDWLWKIYLSHSIINYADGALLSGLLKPKELIKIEEFMYTKIEEIRPQLLNIIESYINPYNDESINSSLGFTKGESYEDLFNSASNSSLNWKTKLASFDKYIKPMSERMMSKM